MENYFILIPDDTSLPRPSLPNSIVFLEVLDISQNGLIYRDKGEGRATMPFAPSPCLALLASAQSTKLMKSVRGWLLDQGAVDTPELTIVDAENSSKLVEHALLRQLLVHTSALASLASRQAQQIASLRLEVETLVGVRAELDRFVADVGIAQLACTFSTIEPDFETQIELTPGSPLRQLLPIVSTGLAAIDLACAATSQARVPLSVSLSLIEEGRTLAEWRVPPPQRDGWLRLGLPRAYAGPARSLALFVEPASDNMACANLALSAYQPLVAAQLSDAQTGEIIAPHALAFRAYAAIPGTTPPHSSDTLFPDELHSPPITPYTLQALTAEVLAGVVADCASNTKEAVPVLHASEAAAILCRAGVTGRVPAACPTGTRGLLVRLSVRAEKPTAIRLTVGIDQVSSKGMPTIDAEASVVTVILNQSQVEEVSILLSEPLLYPADIFFTVANTDEVEREMIWAVMTNLRVVR